MGKEADHPIGNRIPKNILGKEVSRRDFLKILGVGLGTIALGGGLGGLITVLRGEDTSASHTQPTTNTGTTLENQAGIKSLISKDKNIEDVGETITPEGKEITTPFNVSDKFQAEVKAEFSGQQALYMDQDNRGPKDSIVENEFNATLVTVGGVDSNSGVKFDRFGGMFPLKQDVKKEDGQVESKTVFPQIAMKFVDIVLVPGSSDFYLHGIDPLNNNADIYVRIVRDENGKFGQTALQCFDLNNKEGFAYHIPDEDRSKYLASKIALEKFFVPGDTVAIFTGIKLVGKGDERKVVYDLDENGKQTAMQAGIIRYKGADKINSLFK